MSEKEQKIKIVHNEKEYEFLASELSDEAKAQFQRANQIGASCVQMEQELMERRFLLNNYVSFVANELDKDVDDKEKK
tara:strand:+ start:917 stop:1150 length:234 start_codon:yes stop_codon:yes gene_type:complete